VKIPIFKAKHFRCRSLKNKGNRSGIRVIYAYIREMEEIALIEIYSKNKKENHEHKRILQNFSEKITD
jgi:hypothetical protein